MQVQDEPSLGNPSLYDRLGGVYNIATVVDDLIDRVMVDERTATEAGPVAWLLAPLAAGASLVLSRSAEPGGLARRAVTERVTATLGLRLDGVRELGRSS